MYTAELTSDIAPGLRPLVAAAGAAGVAGGAFVLVDSLAVDAFGNEATLPNLVGVLAPALGLLLLTGIFVRAWLERPGRLLGMAYVLNALGLALVLGVDVTRTLVLVPLDDAVVTGLLESGPTAPGLFACAGVYIVGTVLFGCAMLRRQFPVVPTWLYIVTAVPSGLVALLPDVVGAAAQTVAGVAIVWLGVWLRGAAPRTQAG